MQHISNCRSKYRLATTSKMLQLADNLYYIILKAGTLPVIPVVVPPPHHVLIVGGGGDLKPLDVFIGAKKEGVVPRCVV